MASFKFNNGHKVSSFVSGFKGTITSRSEQLHGCNRYFLQPQVGEDGKLPDGYWHDEVELRVESDANVFIIPPKGWKFNLGDKVEDYTTGFRGIVTFRSEHMNGCMFCFVTPKWTSKKTSNSEWVEEGALVLLRAVDDPAKRTAKKTGGPVSRFS